MRVVESPAKAQTTPPFQPEEAQKWLEAVIRRVSRNNQRMLKVQHLVPYKRFDVDDPQ